MRCVFLGILVLSIVAVTPIYSEQYMLVRVYTGDIQELARLGLDIIKVKKGIVEVVAFPEQIPKLEERGFSFDIIIDDMEKYYSERMSGRTNFGNFYTYSEANTIVDSLYTAHSNIMTPRIEIGQGWKGNKIWAVKVSDNPNTDEKNEPEVLYDACIHAREPITVNIMVETIRYLADRYGSDPEVTSVVNNCELWFILVLNPDGYLYNESTNPDGGGMWRKNRRSDPGPVDLNRNFPYNWGYDDVGSSPDPNDETYRGPSSASEPETQAYINFCKEHEFVINLSYHSVYGCLIYPWDYDGSYVSEPDFSTYVAMAETLTSENNYPYGTITETLWYVANGGTIDWMYGDTTKPKIFSLSPEVSGNGFWDEASIPRNLAECIPMNLKLARLAQDMCTPGVEASVHIPSSFAISQNRPNPFSPDRSGSVISYQLPVKCHVSLKIYDCTGKLVKTLVNEEKEPGYYSVSWNGEDSSKKRVPSGMYFYRFETDKFNKTVKLLILR